MPSDSQPRILALETSCDETAVAVTCGARILASEISSQIELHRPYGGVVPEVASRNHNLVLRPLIDQALAGAGLGLELLDAFAATAGPGLASSLLIGNTTAKAMALARAKPFFAINHLEGHLLSPFIGDPDGVQPSVGLVVSGGHTMLVRLCRFGHYELLGKTRDDAAGEAFDKGAKMLGLPYPGGPEIDRLAQEGDPQAFDFPRSMMERGNFEFSFSGLKTSLLYQLEKLSVDEREQRLPDLCAAFQAAIVDVLVAKAVEATRKTRQTILGVSGGVSCNTALRQRLMEQCAKAGIELRLATPALCTDNAGMIGYVAGLRLLLGVEPSSLDEDIDPNLGLAMD